MTFAVVLPIICQNMRFSLFFREGDQNVERQRQQKLNDRRLMEAYRFFHDYQSLSTAINNQKSNSSKHSIDVVISIITVSRNQHKFNNYEPKFLSQIVWKFLSLLRKWDDPHLKFHLFVCNVDDHPKQYLEAIKLSKYVPVINKFENNSATTFENIIEKEKQDYVFCLAESLRLRPRHVLLVEDDALPHDNILNIIRYTLQNQIDQMYTHGTHQHITRELAYVKFYHPDRLLSFISFEVERIPELLGISTIFGTLLSLIYAKLFHLNLCTVKEATALFVLFSLYSLCVAIVIGRQHLMSFRYLSMYLSSFVPAPFCCTPAMLFPAVNAQKVVDFLSSVTCKNGYAKDYALVEFYKKAHLRPYLVQPNYFTHIGFVSSLRNGLLNPFIV